MAAPYRWREAQIAQEVEAAQGTAETLLAADQFIASDITLTPSWTNTANEGQTGFLSKEPGVSGIQTATLAFTMALKGSGTAATPPMFGELLLGCGWSETINGATDVTYVPASPDTTLTLGVNVPGAGADVLSYVLVGCMGTVVFTLKAGELYSAAFTFTGVGPTVTDGATLAAPVSWESTAPQAFIGAAFLMHTVAVPFETITIDMGQEVGIRPDPSSSSTTGAISAQITNRRVTGTVDLEAQKLTDFDVWTKVGSNTLGALDMTPTGLAGNKLDFSLPNVRFHTPTIADRNGIQTTPVSFEALRSATAGNDEISIVHT